MPVTRRFQFGLRNALWATTWLSIPFAALAVLGMAWRGDIMWNWPDAVAAPIVGGLLVLVISAPFVAVAILFSKPKTGIVVSLVFASLYVAFNWLFANW